MQNWVRWPHATAAPETLVVERRHESDPLPAFIEQPGLMLHRSGRSVVYPLAPHEACWRTYGEIVRSEPDLPDPLPRPDDVAPGQLIHVERLIRFTRHYGPLQLRDSDREPFSASMAVTAGDVFARLALHWSQPKRADQLSRRLADTAVPDEARRLVFIITGHLAQPTPPSLLSFMIESALRHIRQEMPMTRCRACGNWIAMTRTDRQYCDGACRQARSVGKALRGRRQSIGGG